VRDWMSEELLTVDEVAAVLRVTGQTVRNYLTRGLLPHIKVGRRVRIARSDFERFLSESYTGASIEQTVRSRELPFRRFSAVGSTPINGCVKPPTTRNRP
jgi:excisionase family DNA binding protein